MAAGLLALFVVLVSGPRTPWFVRESMEPYSPELLAVEQLSALTAPTVDLRRLGEICLIMFIVITILAAPRLVIHWSSSAFSRETIVAFWQFWEWWPALVTGGFLHLVRRATNDERRRIRERYADVLKTAK